MEELGYNIMSPNEFKEITSETNDELQAKFVQEKFEQDFDPDCLDYNIVDIQKVHIDDKGYTDIDYIDKNINTTYLEWYYEKDYEKGMLWYQKEYPELPMIEEMSYLLVKNDLKGIMKLEKFEKHILKNELKKKHQKLIARNKDERQQIAKIKKDKLNMTTVSHKNTTIKFNSK